MRADVPVAFIIFNRPDTTAMVFEEIRKAKPSKLYVIADGARPDREGEKEKTEECRRYVEEHIDWPCTLEKIYSDVNLGCKVRVYTGITEVLEKEPWTIILEDDVVPTQSFFDFCSDLLHMYSDDKKVMMISGTNYFDGHEIKDNYTFSCFSSIWGWATWARAWQYYDPDIKRWPEIRKSGKFKRVQGGIAYLFLKEHMDSVYEHRKDTWDLQWDFARHSHRGLGIVPAGNLVRNIGFEREDATHTNSNGASDMNFSYGSVSFPLEKKAEIKRDVDYDAAFIKKYYGMKKLMKAGMRRMHIIK